MKNLLLCLVILSSVAYGEESIVIGGDGEGSSQYDYAIEQAESNMYKNAFEHCGNLTPIRIDEISHADVGYLSHAYATFICLKEDF